MRQLSNSKNTELDLEEFEMELIDYGLNELDVSDNICNILCHFDKFGMMQDKLSSMSLEIKSAEIQRIPHETKDLPAEEALKILSTIEKFEENDDVQQVFHNLNITEEIIDLLDN